VFWGVECFSEGDSILRW